jgi:hypothetical protein
MPRMVPLPKLAPSPTPVTEYLATHPETSMMSLAKVCGLNYDTVCKAALGVTVPTFMTMLRLQTSVGIPVMAWAGTKAVRMQMEPQYSADPNQYNRKQNRWRKKKRATDLAYGEKERAKFKRSDDRKAARKRGEHVPPLPIQRFGEA